MKIKLIVPVILCLVLSCGMMMPFLVPDAAAGEGSAEVDSVLLSINGTRVDFGVPVILINATTYVPIYYFSMAMGVDYVTQYDGMATVSAPGLRIYANAGDPYLVANGRYLHVPYLCREIDGQIYVPIRPLAYAFGAELAWNSYTRTVSVVQLGEPIKHGDYFYCETDVFWMSRIISAEARGEPFVGQIAVGNVVMNRVDSYMYPDTIHGVIFDRRHGIQFTPAHSGAINRTPYRTCIIAAKLALEGANVIGDSLFFSSSRITCWASRNRPFNTRIGNHNFFD
ncbi:MAG: cell wall hydrolase [Oscillospiraceae bacterium]|nr:cell wall hydrolase [Oscillospiraceae bacterium]